MVQQHNEEDLSQRFSRVEQLKLERRRQEKFESLIAMHHNFVVGLDPVRRVLFEPDNNLQSWIDGELGKIAESQRQEWNFDFKRGVPAQIPGHKWDWEAADGNVPPRRAPRRLAPRAAACSRSAGQTPRSPRTPKADISPKPGSSVTQKRITDFMTARKHPYALGSAKKSKLDKHAAPSTSDESGEENDPTVTAQ